jgi:hypothetical protein
LARRLGGAAQATIRQRFDGDQLAGQLAMLFQQTLMRPLVRRPTEALV